VKPSRTVTICAGLLLAASLAGSALSLNRVDQLRRSATLEEIIFIPSPKALKRLSLGYTGLLADIYWTRAVQYFGGRLGTGRYELLSPLLQITTELDPKLMPAYEYGANFLAMPPMLGAGQPRKAAELIQSGIRNNPDDWHLYHDLGFVNYMELKDYRAAADAFARGSQLPGAHPFLKIMAGRLAEHAGDYQMALLMWGTTYQTTNDRIVRATAAAHIESIKVDQEVVALEQTVAQYKARTGHLPRSFSDLVSSGLLPGVPLDPMHQPFLLTTDGHILVQHPDDFPYINKGTPPGYVSPLSPQRLPIK
jgi:tetratricopeptide (TPR) repeat protein